MKSRRWLKGLGVSLGLALVVSPNVWAKTTISYQYNWYAVNRPGYNEAFQAMIDAFNRSQNEIHVEGFSVPGTMRNCSPRLPVA